MYPLMHLPRKVVQGEYFETDVAQRKWRKTRVHNACQH